MDKLKLIKTLVFLFTFLLVFGSLTALGTIYQRLKGNKIEPPATVNLGQPGGSSIASVKQTDNLLLLLVKDGGLPDRVVVYDLNTAKPLTQININ